MKTTNPLAALLIPAALLLVCPMPRTALAQVVQIDVTNGSLSDGPEKIVSTLSGDAILPKPTVVVRLDGVVVVDDFQHPPPVASTLGPVAFFGVRQYQFPGNMRFDALSLTWQSGTVSGIIADPVISTETQTAETELLSGNWVDLGPLGRTPTGFIPCTGISGTGAAVINWAELQGFRVQVRVFVETRGPVEYPIGGWFGELGDWVDESIDFEVKISPYPPGLGAHPGDFNADGRVTPQDLFDFLAAWFAVAGGVQDLFDFLAAWAG